jgi:probable F420-dependent oxidoreductase
MEIGAVLPQTEIEADAGAIRAYGHGVEALGYRHVLAYDHVVGADPAVHPGWAGPYDLRSTFHEPFAVFGFLAGITTVELVTGVIILPQRQTVLVAKQAAELDVLTGGRFRLGVGIGWNRVEYEALGQDFTTRGRRLEEQIALLRRLWTQESVTFDGEFDRVTGAGLAPMPVRRPIPIWIGGSSAPAYRRMGRLADGWFPQLSPGAALDDAMALVATSARNAGRDPATIGMHARATWRGRPEAFAERAVQWRALGATHLSVSTTGAGLRGADAHLEALAAASNALGASPA